MRALRMKHARSEVQNIAERSNVKLWIRGIRVEDIVHLKMYREHNPSELSLLSFRESADQEGIRENWSER